jgi:hypothetical protein
MARSNHIFPLFLDGAAVTSSTNDYTIPVTTSYVILSSGSSQAATLPNGTIPGQLMTILSKNAGTKTVNITTELSDNVDAITMSADGVTVLLMWTGSAWATLMAEAPSAA